MGWSVGYDSNWGRDIGYGVPATCDHPDCGAEIDRGLSYVCGGQPYGGDDGCGLYFCGKHGGGSLCDRCEAGADPFGPTPDVREWIDHKETDPSWAEWRADRYQSEVEAAISEGYAQAEAEQCAEMEG